MMTMNAGLKKLNVTLTITAILLSFTQANMKMVSSSDTARKIDLFTQKIPFNGKGINQSSDAFEPQELVILYALVTYNEAPIANELVAFQVNNPANAFQNITVVRVSSTNQSGIAQFSFRIPWPCENAEQIIFGEWSAIATVNIAEQVVVDTLTFQVGWIIKITKITTLNATFEPQTKFLRGDIIVFDLTVENIALIPKSATIIIDAQDANSYSIIYVEMDNLVFQLGENHVRASSQIPTTASIGEATVLAAAYTAPPKIDGVLYSPATLSSFEIIRAPVPVEKHDIAITSVSASPLVVCIGTPIEITVETVNLGNFTETFNVTVYYDAFRIATKKVESLDSGFNVTMSFIWDTVDASIGNYTIWALADFLPEEVNVENNVFTDGEVTLLPKPPPPIIDIGIVDVNISKSSLYIGESLQINVSIINKGTETETFNVETYYDSLLIGILRVCALSPNTQVTLNFVWNTSSVQEGFYQISASAPLPNDVNLSDNTFVDGIVQVKTKPSLMVHDVAVLNVVPSPILACPGETISIYVVVKNEGTYVESFNVTAFYDSSIIETLFVDGLAPMAERLLVFYWDTQNVLEGNYTLSALASVVPGEENVENNLYVDGVVEVKAKPPPPPSTYLLNITSSPISDVNFTINSIPAMTPYSATHIEGFYTIAFPPEWTDLNTGRRYVFSRWEDSSTNLTRTINLVSDMMLKAYYEEAVSTHTLSITSDPIIGVDFTIDGVKQTTPYSATLEEKGYTIVMPASVTDSETGKVYNFCGWEDGSTNLTRIVLLDRDADLTAYYEEVMKGWFVPVWFYWLLLLLLVLIIVLLIIWFYRRRRKKAEEAFYSGWTAWYYCYDLRSKIRKI